MKTEETIKYIMNFGKSGKPVHDLSRIKTLLEKCGNPQDNLKFIHIAGTNGKGSCVEYISQGLIHAGYKTGQFTSPFIRRYNDRIRINNNEIPTEKLCEYFTFLDGLNITHEASQFEITLAAAFMWYRDEKCDIVVLETGIGGLLDATNIIENPVCSVITSISYDHTAILGDTIEKIAAQKSGIIKPNCPVVTTFNQNSEALEVIKKTAVEKNSKLVIPDKNNFKIISRDADGFKFVWNNMQIKLRMPGEHQVENAAVATEALKFARINANDIKYGLEHAYVEGRIELLRKYPNRIYVDGGHNPDGVGALCRFLKDTEKNNKIVGIIGMKQGKDYKTACEEFSEVYDEIICVDGFMSGEIPSAELAKEFSDKKVSSMNVEAAYKIAKNIKDKTVVFCGSLYLASKILEKESKKKEIQI